MNALDIAAQPASADPRTDDRELVIRDLHVVPIADPAGRSSRAST